MTSLETAAMVFACLAGGAGLGMAVRRRLPAEHLTSEAKDVVKLGTGLIGTMAALLLGLLTASAKTSFDAENSAVKQTAAQLLSLDRALAQYGPEATPLRTQLHTLVEERVATIWPADAPARPDMQPRSTSLAEEFLARLRQLSPTGPAQRDAQATALKLTEQILEARFLVFTQAAGSAIPIPFLVVVVFWLTLVFGSFAILSPPNATVAVVLLLSALSVSGALFLVMEMDTPFEGLLRISPAPLQYALARMGQ
jgi:hypothetical protein